MCRSVPARGSSVLPLSIWYRAVREIAARDDPGPRDLVVRRVLLRSSMARHHRQQPRVLHAAPFAA